MNFHNVFLIKPPMETSNHPGYFWLDLTIYIAVMFLIREVYFSQFNFITNGLFWSLTTLVVATGLMRFKSISWRNLGLVKPECIKRTIIATVFILIFTVLSIIAFHVIVDAFSIQLSPDLSEQRASGKFGNLKNNWSLFMMIIPFVWLQSALEELLDRGYLISWIEGALSSTTIATIVAVISQAFIFGFRHSYDLSERSITVALIGLTMGIAYVIFGRNLWPLIIAHCILNTLSMAGRV